MKMKQLNNIYLFCCLIVCVLLAGCVQQDEFDSDQVGNFEALWSIMDEHYSFFDYKQVNWDEVHQRYRALVSNQMTDRELFDICGDMLKELRDGHTNLIASHDVSRYWIWEQWPVNYDERRSCPATSAICTTAPSRQTSARATST